MRMRNCYACGRRQRSSALCQDCAALVAGDHGPLRGAALRDPARQQRLEAYARLAAMKAPLGDRHAEGR